MNNFFLRYKNEIKIFSLLFLFGVLIHLNMLTNKFPGNDSLCAAGSSNFYANQNIYNSGRFSLTFLAGISSYFDLNVVNGLLSIIYINLTSLIICKLFKVKSLLTQLLIGLLLVSFPYVCSLFTFMYTADAYFLAVLLAVISLYILLINKKNIILSIILFSISLGTYQAYISIVILLFILYLINEIINKNTTINNIISTIIYFITYIIGSMVIYILLMKLSLLIYGGQLSNYQGLNNMLNFNYDVIINAIKNMYFLKFDTKFIFWQRWFNPNKLTSLIIIFLFLSSCVYFVYLVIKRKIFADKHLFIFLVLLIFAIPFGLNVMYLLAPEAIQHTLLKYQYVLLFVFVLTLFDVNDKKIKLFIYSLICVLIYNYILIDNIGYFYMQQRYERSYSLATRIVDRVEKLEVNMQDMKIAFVNIRDFKFYEPNKKAEILLEDLYEVGDNNMFYLNASLKYFIENYIGYEINLVGEQDLNVITKNKEVQNMPKWPIKDCIKIIDNVIVIKLG